MVLILTLQALVLPRGQFFIENHVIEKTSFFCLVESVLVVDFSTNSLTIALISTQLCMLLTFLDQKMMLKYKELKNRAWKHSSHKRPAYHRSVNTGEKVKIEVEELCISKCSGSLNSHFLF